jgi:hypothetical protein
MVSQVDSEIYARWVRILANKRRKLVLTPVSVEKVPQLMLVAM